MTRPLHDTRPFRVPHLPRRSTPVVVGGLVVLLVVVSALVFWRPTRPCGAGAGDPQEAVRGVLAALHDDDERGSCRRVSSDYRIPEDQAGVLRDRVAAAGGVNEVSVAEVGGEQIGARP